MDLHYWLFAWIQVIISENLFTKSHIAMTLDLVSCFCPESDVTPQYSKNELPDEL